MSDVRWPRLRERLAGLETDALLDLLRQLCERSAENRRFLAALVLQEDRAGAVEAYREGILAEFAGGGGARAPRLGEARKAIRDYRKATGDLEGTTDLRLTLVEAGTSFSREHGDMSEAYYHSLALVLAEAAKHLRADAFLYGRWQPRLVALRQMSRRVGWGFGSYVDELVGELERSHAT